MLVQQGERVEIRCDVEKSVSPYPTLSWIKDGDTLHTDGRVNTTLHSVSYRSEFSMYLRISEFTPSDRGTYQCRSTNGLGTVHSKQVYLDLKGDEPYWILDWHVRHRTKHPNHLTPCSPGPTTSHLAPPVQPPDTLLPRSNHLTPYSPGPTTSHLAPPSPTTSHLGAHAQ